MTTEASMETMRGIAYGDVSGNMDIWIYNEILINGGESVVLFVLLLVLILLGLECTLQKCSSKTWWY